MRSNNHMSDTKIIDDDIKNLLSAIEQTKFALVDTTKIRQNTANENINI